MVMQAATPTTEAPVTPTEKKQKRPRHGKEFLIRTENDVLTLIEYCEQNDRSYNALNHKLGEHFRNHKGKVIRLHESDELLARQIRGRLEARKFYIDAVNGSVVSGFEKDKPEGCTFVLNPAAQTFSLDGGTTWQNMVWIKGEILARKSAEETAKSEDPLA